MSMNKTDLRLTDAALIRIIRDFGPGQPLRAVRDAQLDFALSGVVAWLRTYGPREEFVALELEAILNEERADA